MHKVYRIALGATALSACVGTMSIPAFAQEDQTNSPASTEDSGGQQDIIVTAQRRAEKSQDVPIAISTFQSEQMGRIGLKSTDDLPRLVPGLTTTPTGIRGYFYLRGLGNNGVNSSPSVLMYVDGVYQAFNPPVNDFSDVAQISVLKGPQGTLFGRNATAGVIQITTASPFDWQGVEAKVGYANYETLSLNLRAATKISENVAVGIAGYYENQQDGWGTNLFDGSDVLKAKRYGARGKIVARLDDTFTATLAANYSYLNGNRGSAEIPALGRPFYNQTTGTTFTLPGRFDALQDTHPIGFSEGGSVSLTLDKDLGAVKLLSISSYQTLREKALIDQDGTASPRSTVQIKGPRHAFTQELQISGGSSAFKWVGGLYYFHLRDVTSATFGGTSASGPPFFAPPGGVLQIIPTMKTNAYAAFAEGTAEVLPNTNLTLGARYTVEKKYLEASFAGGSPVRGDGFQGSQSKTYRKPTFRASIDHRFSPELLAYASYNRGFNAGFFNSLSFGGYNDTANPAVEPEGVDAYEIGFKSDLLDRRLQINGAAFLYKYSNLQQTIVNFGQISTVNAARANIKGIDLDIVAHPTRSLTLSLSANYLDTEYTSYPKAPFYSFAPDGRFVRAVLPQDAAGNRLVQSPKFSLQATVSHRLETGIGSFETTGNIAYQSNMYVDPQNDFAIPGRTLVGLSEQWTSKDDLTTVTGWVKNLTNKEYDITHILLAPIGLVGTPGTPRTYGVTVARRF